MKIAFVDNLPVGGGLSRFSLKLCESLINNYKDLKIDYFIHENNLEQIPEIITLNERVVVKLLQTTKKRNKAISLLNRVANKVFRVAVIKNKTIKEIEQRVGKDYQLAYFPSAHMMEMPNLYIPIAGTIHDFNWRYFFGAEIFSNDFIIKMDKAIQQWLNKAACISSAQDVVNEAKKLYPTSKNYPAVIPIAQVVVSAKIEKSKAVEILQKLKINYPYIIFPGNFFPHKNHLNLFTAFYLLKQQPAFKSYKLILTGMGTDKIKKAVAEYRGIRKVLNDLDEFDVIGMGYQSNESIDALIMNAALLVSPSIYEAICTPAMDAWSYATPTAISDIAPFREHEKAWGVKTAYFDPMNPHNIAETLAHCLMEIDKSKSNALISQKQLAMYTWDKIAISYMNVFIKAINK